MLASFFEWRKYLAFLFDILYPPTCVCCEASGTWVCPECWQKLDFTDIDVASPCAEDELKDPLRLRFVALGAYANPILRRLLTHLKYRSATCLLESITQLLREYRSHRSEPWPWIGESALTICAIPSDDRRVRARGLDHAQLLMEIVHRELVPWADSRVLLKRVRHIKQNAALPHDALRFANVQNIFAACSKIDTPVLLIDDVYTTGATWHEAEKTLRQAGAPRVYGFVFAKG